MSGTRVRSAEAWKRLRDLAAGVFDLTIRLPSVVSHLPTGPAPFFDGDVMFGEFGWPLAATLAMAHDDAIVNLLVVDPDSDYFLEATGEYGGFTCPSGARSNCYLSGLFGEIQRDVIGQIGYTAESVALFGESKRWGIWVERGVAGVVVSADPSVLGPWELENGPFLTVEDALQDFLGVNVGGASVDSAFTRSLVRNYGTFRDDR